MDRLPMFLCLVLALSAASATAQNGVDPARRHRTPTFSEEGAAACLRCHSGPEMRAVQSGPHFNVRSPAAPTPHHYCESCHGPGSIHVSRAHGGKGFPPLTQFGRGPDRAPREEQLAACLNCHGNAEAVPRSIGFIGSPHDRPNISCSTCHTVHAESDAVNDRERQASLCFRCHRRQQADHPRFESRSMDVDRLPCSACHDVHLPLPAPG